jgi:murein biosynthesis integral membrane protein MurJ
LKEISKKLVHKFSSSSRRISIGLTILKLFRSLGALLIIILSARYFGTSAERDAWIIGGTIVTVLIQIFFGPINETFRAKYVHLKQDKPDIDTNKTLNSLVSSTIIISLLLIISGVCFPGFFASCFSPNKSDILTLMIRILLPSLLLVQLTNILSSILNAHSSFYLPDTFNLFSIILNILILIALSPVIGIYSLVVSSYLSSFFLLIVLAIRCKRKINYQFKFVFPEWHLIKPFILFAFPFYINYIFSQADIVIEKNLLSRIGTGSISIMDYARKFSDLPVTIMISVVLTVLTPVLSSLFARKERYDAFQDTQKFFRMLMLCITPMAAVFIALPKEVINLLLVHGQFTEDNVPITASLLQWYSLGMVFTAVYLVYAQALIAQKKTYFFSVIVIGTYVLKILFNLFFYQKLGLATFAISWCACQFITANIMLYYSIREYRKSIVMEALKIYSLAAAIIILSKVFYNALQMIYPGTGYYKYFLLVSAVSIVILIIELVLMYLLNIPEKEIVNRALSGVRKKMFIQGKIKVDAEKK